MHFAVVVAAFSVLHAVLHDDHVAACLLGVALSAKPKQKEEGEADRLLCRDAAVSSYYSVVSHQLWLGTVVGNHVASVSYHVVVAKHYLLRVQQMSSSLQLYPAKDES